MMVMFDRQLDVRGICVMMVMREAMQHSHCLTCGQGQRCHERIDEVPKEAHCGKPISVWVDCKVIASNSTQAFGKAEWYKPLVSDADGKSKSLTDIPLPMPDSGDFFIMIHESSAKMRTIAACASMGLGD